MPTPIKTLIAKKEAEVDNLQQTIRLHATGLSLHTGQLNTAKRIDEHRRVTALIREDLQVIGKASQKLRVLHTHLEQLRTKRENGIVAA